MKTEQNNQYDKDVRGKRSEAGTWFWQKTNETLYQFLKQSHERD
ncbi:hypothetical protein [Lentibacillus jeotgali]|nr:hypothetical protein [Lentibacillus jeotgali]